MNILVYRKRPAIMVAGCPRSGSTILAKILNLSPRTAYLEEPLNPQTGLLGTTEGFVYLHTVSPLRTAYDPIVTNMLHGRAAYKPSYFRPERPGPARQIFYKLFTNRYHLQYKLGVYNPAARIYLTKDPTASLSAEYLHRQFGYRVVLTLRHPCAVVASHQQLGWRSPLAVLLARPDLSKYFSKALQNLNPDDLNDTQALAWYWRAINELLLQFCRRNPDFLLVENEHFSRQPLAVSQYLYEQLGLPYTARIERVIKRLTSSTNATEPQTGRAHTLKRNSQENVDRWKKLLGENETKEIMRICGNLYTKLQAAPNNLANQAAFATKPKAKPGIKTTAPHRTQRLEARHGNGHKPRQAPRKSHRLPLARAAKRR